MWYNAMLGAAVQQGPPPECLNGSDGLVSAPFVALPWLGASPSLWLYADYLRGSGNNNPFDNNAPVCEWLDLSGNNRHTSQPLAALRPVFAKNVANGRAVVRFDYSTNDANQQPVLSAQPGAYNVNGLTQFTMCAVSRAAVGTTPGGFGCDRPVLAWTESGPWGNTSLSPHQTQIGFRFGKGQFNSETVYNRPAPVNGFTFTCSVKDGATERLYVDGVLAATYTFAATMNTNQDFFHVGRAVGAFEPNGFRGDVAEIVTYQAALTDQQVSDLYSYFQSKYAL